MENQLPRTVQAYGTKFLRQLRWITVATAGICLLLAAFGISYQVIEARADAHRFHQVGRSVDVGGYKLNIDCTGEGSPTVILVSGLEVPASGWRLAQPRIATFTRVCSYDRAGYAWSEPGPMPRTLSQLANELRTIADNANDLTKWKWVMRPISSERAELLSIGSCRWKKRSAKAQLTIMTCGAPISLPLCNRTLRGEESALL
jgi:hypothetical protein